MKFLGDLAVHVRRLWEDHSYSERSFTEVASTALETLPPHELVTAAEIFDHVLSFRCDDHLTPHPSDEIIKLWQDDTFAIFAHFWGHRFAMPHLHAWNGAYQIIEGSSVQAFYSFDERWRRDSRFRLGHLRTHRIDLLQKGATVPVQSGDATIHGLAYLDRPSISLSVRSRYPPGAAMDCWRPGLLIDVGPTDSSFEHKRRLLSLLAQTDPEQALEHAKRLIDYGTLRQCFRTLQCLTTSGLARGSLDPLHSVGRERHGEPFETVFDAAVDEVLRGFAHAEGRRLASHHDHLLLLAALYFAADRQEVLDFIASAYPEASPSEYITRWITEMSIVDPDTGFNLLGLSPVDQSSQQMLRFALDGRDTVAAALAGLREIYPADQLEALDDRLRHNHDLMANHALLRTLFKAS